MKKGLSGFANYCRDRNIGVLLRGFTTADAFYDIYFPRKLSERTRRGFEKRLRADNPKRECRIAYL